MLHLQIPSEGLSTHRKRIPIFIQINQKNFADLRLPRESFFQFSYADASIEKACQPSHKGQPAGHFQSYSMITLDVWFIAPFTEQNRGDIMTQLSSLHLYKDRGDTPQAAAL